MGIFGQKAKSGPGRVPILIIEDMVCFPGSLTPLYLSNKIGLKAVETAMAGNRNLLIVYKPKGAEIQGRQTFSDIASLCRINQVMRLPNNSSRVLVECTERVRLLEIFDVFSDSQASYEELDLDNSANDSVRHYMRSLIETFRIYSSLGKKTPPEAMQAIEAADSPHKMIDLICGASPSIPLEKRLALFLISETIARLEELLVVLEAECQLLELREGVKAKVKKRLETNQKEYFINEQIKELKGELGKEEDDLSGAQDLERRFGEKNLPSEVRARVTTELKRLSRLAPMTPEASIVRTWLELVADLPWSSPLPPLTSPESTLTILNEDHYDLEDAKDRIVDFLAARHFNPGIRSPILCFVGPPGTGKTSLGRSIARALGRSFVRISLGGVRDEAEIRGHRRTYVGALPGKIIQGIKKSGSTSPVFLLDELDKLASDNRGDPSSALLEVLDPEQNHSFADHYLEIPYDLSQVLFIATANNISSIPAPLRDRMEIIEIPGYTPFEKIKIAQGFIIPRQLKEHGLRAEQLSFSRAALETIIDTYTFEAGVRQLDRTVAKIISKSIRSHLDALPPVAVPHSPPLDQSSEPGLFTTFEKNQGEGSAVAPQSIFPSKELNPTDIHAYLKKPRTRPWIMTENLPPGLAYGLAWTENGGTVLPVEVALSSGKGDFTLTGNLGDVMKESARIAFSMLRSGGFLQSNSNGDTANSAKDIHIHVPEGAIPKDGPSAGITLSTALYGALAGRCIKPLLAMTGEITLTGRVLPVGGIREKVLAAHRLGFTQVILPERNSRDVELLPDEIQKEITIHVVSTIQEVFSLAFADDPKAIKPRTRKKAV